MQSRSYACPRCETPHRLQLKFHLVTVAGDAVHLDRNKYDKIHRLQLHVFVAQQGHPVPERLRDSPEAEPDHGTNQDALGHVQCQQLTHKPRLRTELLS